MLQTFVVALREGLEASLIVGILVAYLVKSGRTHLLRSLWTGVFAAIGLSLAFGAVLTFTSASLSKEGEELFAGVTGIIAVSLVTWMVFWMKRTARFMKLELEQKASAAVGAGTLAFAAFTAVAREGLETSLFLYANFKSSNAVASTFGLILGLAVAVGLGYGIYRGAIRFNLATFFKVSGVALILVAANVLEYSLHELHEVGLFFDGNASIYGAILYVLMILPAYLAKAKPAKPEELSKKISLTK